jgi:hypothetical protein
VGQDLVSWTVQADDGQVETLSRHPGIKRITKLNLPSTATPTETATGSQAGNSSPGLAGRQEVVRSWILAPANSKDMDEVNRTTEFLKSLTNTDPLPLFREVDVKELLFWSLSMTDAQCEEAVKHPGILSIGPNDDLFLDSLASPAAAPSTLRNHFDAE